jgi:Flp pilus assembly protein TadD
MTWWRRRRPTGPADALTVAARERGVPVVTTDDPERVAIALAVAAYRRGDTAGADRTIHDLARHSSRGAETVMHEFAQALEDAGAPQGAQSYYLKAVMSTDPEVKAIAGLNLAVLWVRLGQLGPAENLLTETMESGHPEAAPKAAFNLGGLLAGQHRYDEAVVALRRAVDSGHPDEAPGALTQLGAVLATQGHVAAAEAAFRQVVASRHPEFAATAAQCLADLQRQTGR